MSPRAFFSKLMMWMTSMFTSGSSPLSSVEQRLSITRTCLKMLGFATYQPKWKLGPIGFGTLSLIMMSFAADVRRTLLMLNHKDQERIEDIVEAMVFLATQSVCIYRIYNMIRYKKQHRDLINKLTIEFSEWLTSDTSKATMSKMSRYGNVLFWGDMVIMVATAINFIPSAVWNHSTPTQASGFKIPYVDNQETPYYEILFFLQSWLILTQITMAFACNHMFCALAVVVCGQLECLAEEVPDDHQTSVANMPAFITRHNKIYGSVRELSGLYGSVLGLQPLYTGIVIITSTLLYDGSAKSNLFLQISFDHIVEIFLYCYVGDLVAQKSRNLGEKLYFSKWYTMGGRQKKIILQVMHRCQKPFTLDAGIFGPLTMEMYSKCMQMTYSMWTVFKGRAAKV